MEKGESRYGCGWAWVCMGMGMGTGMVWVCVLRAMGNGAMDHGPRAMGLSMGRLR